MSKDELLDRYKELTDRLVLLLHSAYDEAEALRAEVERMRDEEIF